jgi:hypothetical protein
LNTCRDQGFKDQSEANPFTFDICMKTKEEEKNFQAICG